MKKPSVNAKCPCGSGKKIKHCHGEAVRRWKPIDIGGGFQISAPPRGKLSAVIEEDSPIPQWLIAVARRAAENAAQQGATEYEGFVTLMAVNTAAEAVVNRLLEELVPRGEWEGTSSKRPLERASVAEKWVSLSRLVGVDPPYARGEEPLRAFLKTTDARNELVHFKHGQNVKVFETEGVSFLWGESVEANFDELAKRPAAVLKTSDVEASLAPATAPAYFASLRAVLVPILDKCSGMLAPVAARIREALGP